MVHLFRTHRRKTVWRFHTQDRSGMSWPGNVSILQRCFRWLEFVSWCLLPRRRRTGEADGYDKMDWTSDVDTHPPWLRFHLGITRWELYDRRDPNLDQLTHYLATQRVLGAGQRALTLPHIINLLFILRFVSPGWLHDAAVGDLYSGSPPQWCLFRLDHVDQTRRRCHPSVLLNKQARLKASQRSRSLDCARVPI